MTPALKISAVAIRRQLNALQRTQGLPASIHKDIAQMKRFIDSWDRRTAKPTAATSRKRGAKLLAFYKLRDMLVDWQQIETSIEMRAALANAEDVARDEIARLRRVSLDD